MSTFPALANVAYSGAYGNLSGTPTLPSGAIVGTTDSQTLTNKTINAEANTVSNLATSMFAATVVDTDGTLSANSDSRLASQKAIRTYVDTAVVGLLDPKGVIDCSAEPNYPVALKGDTYVVSVAGKIGGASGPAVEVGDFVWAMADNAGGTQASVGASWNILQYNLPTLATVAATGAYADLSGAPDLSGYALLAGAAFTGTVSVAYAAADAFLQFANTADGGAAWNFAVAAAGTASGGAPGGFFINRNGGGGGTFWIDPTSSFVGINTFTPTYSLDVAGTFHVSAIVVVDGQLRVAGNGTESSARFGAFEIQSQAVNNNWFADNIYYDGSAKYRADGFGVFCYFNGGDFVVYTCPSNTAGATATLTERFRVTNTGDVSIPTGDLDVFGNLSAANLSDYALVADLDAITGGSSASWIVITDGSGLSSGHMEFDGGVTSDFAAVTATGWSTTDADSVDQTAFLSSFRVGDRMKVYKESDPTQFGLYTVSGIPGITGFNLTLIDSNGVCANDDVLIVQKIGLAYIAGNPSDWAGSAPTTIAEAIDRLAAQLAAIGLVPIP